MRPSRLSSRSCCGWRSLLLTTSCPAAKTAAQLNGASPSSSASCANALHPKTCAFVANLCPLASTILSAASTGQARPFCRAVCSLCGPLVQSCAGEELLRDVQATDVPLVDSSVPAGGGLVKDAIGPLLSRHNCFARSAAPSHGCADGTPAWWWANRQLLQSVAGTQRRLPPVLGGYPTRRLRGVNSQAARPPTAKQACHTLFPETFAGIRLAPFGAVSTDSCRRFGAKCGLIRAVPSCSTSACDMSARLLHCG